MKQMEFPALREVCFDGLLSCGCRVRVVPKPGFSKTYAMYAVDYGSVDTAFVLNGVRHTTPAGVAHYLEHKMFDMPYGDAMSVFAARGGSPNAFTGYEMTAYYVECTEQTEENLTTLLEMVSTPCFSERSVEKERGIIAQEIRMYEDSAESRVFENLLSAVYRSHPFRVPIAGTVESIGEITAELLEQCHKTFYAPSNAMLCVVGDVDPEKIFALADRLLKKAVPIRAERDYGREDRLPFERRREMHMEISMPTFAAGFPTVPGEDPMREEFIGDLAADLLLSVSAPLYTRLYEQGLVDGSLSAGFEGVKGAGMLTVSGDSKNPDRVVEAFCREAERLCREGVDPEFLRRQKKAYLGRMIRDLDSFETICCRSCYHSFRGQEFFRFPEVFATVGEREVLEFLSQWVREDHCAVSVILPEKREE